MTLGIKKYLMVLSYESTQAQNTFVDNLLVFVRDFENNTFSPGINITSVLIKTFSKYFSYVLCIVNCYLI